LNAHPAVQISHATVLLTAEQIIEAVRQLDAREREQVLQVLREPLLAKETSYHYSVAALNSPAAQAVWDNPADAAAYDNIPWEPGDALSTR
jgi:hypothetical protein